MKRLFYCLVILLVASTGALWAQSAEQDLASAVPTPSVEEKEAAAATPQESEKSCEPTTHVLDEIMPETINTGGYACRVACWEAFGPCVIECGSTNACLEQCAQERRDCLAGC